MKINALVIVAVTIGALQGCTIARYELRQSFKSEKSYVGVERFCPERIEVTVRSVRSTKTFGAVGADEEYLEEMKQRYVRAAEVTLENIGCKLAGKPDATAVLRVDVKENQQLSALPEEYLTGLSFGIIPSSSTRPAELQFDLEFENLSATYFVDEKRFNHILVTPVFWLSFFLVNDIREFSNALQDFAMRP